jgi:hypothetical protein
MLIRKMRREPMKRYFRDPQTESFCTRARYIVCLLRLLMVCRAVRADRTRLQKIASPGTHDAHRDIYLV